MKDIRINTEFIKLDQFLKWAGSVSTGAEGKLLVGEGKVKVNGEAEIKRGRKLRAGDIIETGKEVFRIEV